MFEATARTTSKPFAAVATCLVAAVVASRCAVPVAPTGGPPDQQPPEVISMVPENNSVNVSGRSVGITFSEHVDEASFQQALTITPEPAERPDLKWSGRSVEIRFKTAPDTNTTYILTISTRLRDLRGVSLKTPITRAFSTGPMINSGKIRGRVLDPVRGTGQRGVQVYAYATTDVPPNGPLPERPLYTNETDEAGSFEFDYLSNRPYYVIGVADRNNNRRIDNLELVAVPPVRSIVADSIGSPVGSPWFAAVLDTVAPEVRRVQSLSDRQIEVRYSEDIRLNGASPRDWIVMDSLETPVDSAQFAYQLVDERRSVYLVTAPLKSGSYLLRPGAVADSAGNRASTIPIAFDASGREDTLRARFVSFLPADGEPAPTTLLPGLRPGLQFSKPVSSVEASRLVSVQDSSGAAVSYEFAQDEAIEHHIVVDQTRRLRSFSVRVRRPGAADSVATRRYSVLSSRDLGGITAVLVAVPDTAAVRVEARRSRSREPAGVSTATGPGRFTISRLPQGSYGLRIFRDDNKNGVWDAARLFPFTSAEPLFWPADSVRVRPRWDTDLDTLRIEGFDL